MSPMQLPDFNSLVKLAKESPEDFEILRKALIEEAITSAQQDSQRRLRGLQFQIDMTRRKSKTPLAACIRISSLMQASLIELRDYINGDEAEEDAKSGTLANAKVLDFKAHTSPAEAL